MARLLWAHAAQLRGLQTFFLVATQAQQTVFSGKLVLFTWKELYYRAGGHEHVEDIRAALRECTDAMKELLGARRWGRAQASTIWEYFVEFNLCAFSRFLDPPRGPRLRVYRAAVLQRELLGKSSSRIPCKAPPD